MKNISEAVPAYVSTADVLDAGGAAWNIKEALGVDFRGGTCGLGYCPAIALLMKNRRTNRPEGENQNSSVDR